jgi:YHS domain-containing protein
MAVDPDRTRERRSYGGDEYVFCSTECALIFDRHPARYTGRHSASLELRVSSEARDRVTERLHRAYRKGRLDENELERRVELAMQARTREDLRVIMHDLPRSRRRVDRRLAPFLPLIILGRAIRRQYRRLRNWRRRT